MQLTSPATIALRLICLTSISLAMTSNVLAQATDEVVLQGASGTSRITIKCEVLDYTGKSLVALSSTGKQSTHLAADVIAVRTLQTSSHDSGIKELAAGRIAEAEALFEKAMNQESRQWVRREILALMIRCSLRKAEWTNAGTRFLRLIQSDPDTRHIALIPLAWSRRPHDSPARGNAILWLREKHSLARLIGASFLVFEPKYAAEVEQVLQELVQHPDERLRTLAQWQQWRRQSGAEETSEIEIKRWEDRIAKLPPEMRAGPYFVLAQGFASRYEFDLAAAAYLRLPFGDLTDHPVKVEALLEAAHALQRCGMKTEATRLYREFLSTYGDSPLAKEAQSSLDKLAGR